MNRWVLRYSQSVLLAMSLSVAAEPVPADKSTELQAAEIQAAELPAAGLIIAEADSAVVQTVKVGGNGVEPAEDNNVPAAAKRSVPHRQAKSVPLDEPVIVEKVSPRPEVSVVSKDTPAERAKPEEAAQQAAESSADSTAPEVIAPLVILNTEVPAGTTTRLSWSPSQSLEGIATPTPVLIVNGAAQGPVLCLTAAIHGDELNGIEIVRRVLYNLEADELAGTVIGVPIVNLQGFHRGSRYLTDRRDLNRYFPGNPAGSSASRIAYSFFEEVVRYCDALVDLHTGSYHRTNMPQLRGDLHDPSVVQLTEAFGATVVLHSDGAAGTLRRAAVDAGIPAVTLEAGESMRLQERAVEHGVNGITTLMSKMGMIDRFSFWGDPEPVYYHSVWVRAEQGGILFSSVELADSVEKGDLLGEVTDPITNIKTGIVSPYDGRVIGMALNQVVLPGFAAFHIATAAPKQQIMKIPSLSERDSDTNPDQASAAGLSGSAKALKPSRVVPQELDVMDVDGDTTDLTDSDDFD